MVLGGAGERAVEVLHQRSARRGTARRAGRPRPRRRASSKRGWMTALSAGFTVSMRAIAASTSSDGVDVARRAPGRPARWRRRGRDRRWWVRPWAGRYCGGPGATGAIRVRIVSRMRRRRRAAGEAALAVAIVGLAALAGAPAAGGDCAPGARGGGSGRSAWSTGRSSTGAARPRPTPAQASRPRRAGCSRRPSTTRPAATVWRGP